LSFLNSKSHCIEVSHESIVCLKNKTYHYSSGKKHSDVNLDSNYYFFIS
jgi:hypothetical protein